MALLESVLIPLGTTMPRLLKMPKRARTKHLFKNKSGQNAAK